MKSNAEEKKQDRKDEEPEEKEYPEGGTDGMIMRDGAPEAKEYPLPDPSAITFTDPMDTARVELKTLREPPDVKIKSMNDVAILVRGMEDYDRERMKVIHLDTKNRVLHVENISTGTINSSIIHPREAVKGAVLSSATSVIIVHNHPSGVPEPSPEDKTVAQALVNAFHLMRIDVLDFIIVAKDWQYSFRDCEGLPRPQDPVIEVLDSTIAEGGSEECQLAYRAAREVLEEQCGK